MIICTHSGCFQADDVMAAAILRSLYPGAQLIRSRKPEDWHRATIVFDVGEKYDKTKYFDHHQKGGAGERKNGVPYAAVGLIWRHYGRGFCERYADDLLGWRDLFHYIDYHLIQALDAHDCGQLEGEFHVRSSGRSLSVATLSSLISKFNPVVGLEPQEESDYFAAFERALSVAMAFLQRTVRDCQGKAYAKSVVRAVDQGEPLLELPEGCDWTHVVCHEMPHVKFVIYPNPTGQYMIRTVPQVGQRFSARVDLPAAWAGLSGADFQALTGVPDAIFCHNGGFVAGAQSLAGVRALGGLALASLNR
jgi:uncharacterized UPF0160 family protein